MRITGSILHTSSHHFLTNSLLNSRSPYSMACVDLSMSSSSPDMVAMATISESHDVTLIKTTTIDSFFLWTYVYPGSTIYLWNHVSKKIMSSYNCLKAFEELNFKNDGSSSREFKITDMSFLNGNLYCGINSGSILVLKRLTLSPLLVFQAHVHQLNRLCPLTFETRLTRIERNKTGLQLQQQQQSKRINSTSSSSSVVKRTQHLLLTLGRALAPIHEEMYLSSKKYRIDALSKYANCLILCAWNSVLND